MKSKLKKKIRREQPHHNGDGLPFALRDRMIFRYCDHGPNCPNANTEDMCKPGCRRIDPAVVMDALQETDNEVLNTDLKLLDTPVPEDKTAQVLSPAMRRLAAMVCKAFGVTELDDKYGLTRKELLALFFDFMHFLAECKKKADGLRTSLGLAAPPVFPSVASLTKPSSGSNSTSAASRPTNPPSSAPESASPSGPTQVNNSGTT